MKNFIVVGGLVLLIAGGLLLISSQWSSDRGAAIDGDGAPKRPDLVNELGMNQSEGDQPSSGKSSVSFSNSSESFQIAGIYRVKTASALMSEAAELQADSPDVRQQVMLAAQFCSYVGKDSVAPGSLENRATGGTGHSDARRHNHEQFMVMLKGFCGDVDAGQLAALAEHAARTSDADPNKEALAFLSSLADADPEVLADSENQKVLMGIASKTESPEVFQRALDLAAIGGTEPLFMDFDRSLPDGISLDRRIELRRLAAQYAVCEWTGGCGPGTLRTISSCTYFGRCVPGYSWEESLGGIYTPREVEGVRNLGRALLRKAKS